MLKQEYFLKLLEKKDLHPLQHKDILSSGMFISQKFLASYIKNFKGYNDYKNLAFSRDMSERDLGPGKYSTPSPPKGPSFQFNVTPRFKQRNEVNFLCNQSVGRIKKPDFLPKIEKNFNKSTSSLEERKKKKKIQEIVNRKTKHLLEDNKRERLLKCLKEKQEKAEYRKDAVIKNAICKSLAILFTFVSIPNSLKNRLIYSKAYNVKVRAYLKFLLLISRVLGKFKIIGKRLKANKALAILRKKFRIFIKKWLQKRSLRMGLVVDSMVQRFVDRSSCRRIIIALMKRILFLQKAIKSYLSILQSRRSALLQFWNKLNPHQSIIPVEIKLHFINKYIKESLTRHYFAINKEKRFSLLLKLNKHEEIIENLLNHKFKAKPTLRLFNPIEILKLIKSAYNSKRIWTTMLPIPLKTIIEEPGEVQIKVRNEQKRKTYISKKIKFETPSEKPNISIVPRKTLRMKTVPNSNKQ